MDRAGWIGRDGWFRMNGGRNEVEQMGWNEWDGRNGIRQMGETKGESKSETKRWN